MFNPKTSRNVYTSRINHVITYITGHLSEELNLEIMAKQAFFSPFHFHRIFSAMVGEPPGSFVNRLRVERAAWMLRHHTSLSVTHIALDCGFSSSAAFSRAFKSAFGISPTQWRRGQDRKICKTNRNQWKDGSESNGYLAPAISDTSGRNAGMSPMDVAIRRMPGYRVAYIANLQGYRVDKILAAWKHLWRWASARDLLTPETVELGISLDDPGITAPHHCRYYVCVTVPANISGDSLVGIMNIPGGKYGVYRFEGLQPELGDAYRRLFSEWLPDSGFQPGNSPCYEICRMAPEDPMTEKMVMDIFIPVAPL